jgi:transcription antitermination factor NusG
MTPGGVGVVRRGIGRSAWIHPKAGRPVHPWPFLRIGQRIRLQAGPLAGAEGIFLRVKDECHLVVSITLLQRAVSVVIEKEAVTPLFFGERQTSFES